MENEKRKLNKFKVGVVVFILVVFLMTISGFGRFVYNNFRDRYLTSKKFYFTSDLLEMNGETYTYENWDGTGIYNFDVELYSKINDLQKLEEDLDYTLMVNFPDNVNCAINSTDFVEPPEDSGDVEEPEVIAEDGTTEGEETTEEFVKPISKTNTIIASESNRDIATIYVKAIDENTVFYPGETIDIEVTAYTTNPYKKSLTATFRIKILTSYTIDDDYNEKYAILTLRNTSDVAQDVTLNIDTEHFYLDMNDEAYVYNKGYTVKEQTVANVANFTYGHINEITFEMPAESSKKIILYKKYYWEKATVDSGWVKVSRSAVQTETEDGNTTEDEEIVE